MAPKSPTTRRRRHSSSPVSTSGDVDVLNILECCICLDTCSIPIVQCTNGHNVCAVHIADHLAELKCCPTCRASYSLGMGRNRLAEKLVENNNKKRKLNPDLPTRTPDSILETIKNHNTAQMLLLRHQDSDDDDDDDNYENDDNDYATWDDAEWERESQIDHEDGYTAAIDDDDDWYDVGDEWGDYPQLGVAEDDDNVEEEEVFGDATTTTGHQEDDDEDNEQEGEISDDDDDDNYDDVHINDFEGDGPDEEGDENADADEDGGEDWSDGDDEGDEAWEDDDNSQDDGNNNDGWENYWE